MADKRVQDQELDALFAAARDDAAQAPSSDLMARVLADAEAMQPKPAAPVVRPQSRGGLVSGILSAIGGWPSLGGLAAATVAGVWIGFSATPTVLPDGLAGLVGETNSDYLAYLDTSYAYLEEDAQ
ncbi:MAG: hypothetical protein GYB25_14675 [Rhodobacteraceae bacterium]|nr:hypothetical protein [Paracoccaceae bacterium]